MCGITPLRHQAKWTLPVGKAKDRMPTRPQHRLKGAQPRRRLGKREVFEDVEGDDRVEALTVVFGDALEVGRQDRDTEASGRLQELLVDLGPENSRPFGLRPREETS